MPEDLVSKLVNRPQVNEPLSLNSLLVLELSSKHWTKLTSQLEDQYPAGISSKTAESMMNMQERYERHQENSRVAKTIVEGTFAGVRASLDLVSVPASASPVSLLAARGAKKLVDFTMEQTLKTMDKEIARGSDKIVRLHFDKLREQTRMSVSEIRALPRAEQRELIFGKGKGISDQSIKFLSKEDKVTALKGMAQILEDRLDDEIRTNWETDTAQQLDINTLKSQSTKLIKYQKALDQTVEVMKGDVKNLETSFSELNRNVQFLAGTAEENSDNIEVLSQHVFGNADTGEKIKLLKAGLFSVKGEERKKTLSKLEALKSKEDSIESVNKLLDNGRHLSNIMKNVGFQGKTARDIVKGVSICQTAMAAFTAYSSGQPLAAVSAITGMFGAGGKADPQAAMNAAIMRKLGVMDAKLDKLLDGHRRIFEALKHVVEQLNAIRSDIHMLHDAQMVKLQGVEDFLKYSAFANVYLSYDDFRIMEDFARKWQSRSQGKSLRYKDYRSFFLPRIDRYEQGRDGLSRVITATPTSDGGISAFLLARTYEGQYPASDRNSRYRTRTHEGFRAITGYIENYMPSFPDFELGYTVIKNLDQIAEKAKYFEESEGKRHARWSLVKSQISTDHLVRASEVLEQTHLFEQIRFSFRKRGSTAYKDLLEYLSSEKLVPTALLDFRRLRELVDIVIIQENLLSGDYLLHHFYESLFGEEALAQGSPQRLAIVEVLTRNDLLRRNLANYLVYRQLLKIRTLKIGAQTHETRFHLFEYALYLNETSEFAAQTGKKTNLRDCFDKKLAGDIVLHPTVSTDEEAAERKRWKIDLFRDDKEAYLTLPTQKDYHAGRILYRKEMLDLIALKARLVDYILDYEHSKLLGSSASLRKFLSTA